jgi:hypothetical protein
MKNDRKALITHYRTHPCQDPSALPPEDQHTLKQFLLVSGLWICATCFKPWSKTFKSCRAKTCAGIPFVFPPEVANDNPPLPAYADTINVADLFQPPVGGPPTLGELEDVFSPHGKTINFIPKSLRTRWNSILSDLIQAICEAPMELKPWLDLFRVPTALFQHRFPKADAIRNRNQPSLTILIAERMTVWESGEEGRDRCWENVLDEPDLNSNNSKPLLEKNLFRCKKLTELGRMRDAVQCLSSQGTAPVNGVNLSILKDKHPEGPLPADIETGASLIVEPSVVKKCIQSFIAGTACGLSGLQAQHLRDSFRTNQPLQNDWMLKKITALVNVLLSGNVHPLVAHYITTSPLIALKKPDQGLRPIAIGEIWRRLVSKCAVHEVRTPTLEYFSPHQLGVGSPGGAEAIVHTAQAIIDEFGHDDSYALLKIDFKNAFNLVNRNVFLCEIKAKYPALLSWVKLCYSNPNRVLFGRELFYAHTGVQQGDPLGPLLFSMVLQPLVQKIKERCPSLKLNAWFLDDGAFIGPTAELLNVLELIKEYYAESKLELNLGKCELWWPTPAVNIQSHFPSDIQFIKESGISLLGSPLGSPEFANDYVDARVDKIADGLTALAYINDSQIEFNLLKSCLGIPKFLFALRTADTDSIRGAIQHFDEIMYESLVNILGGQDFSVETRTQIHLPVSMGGLGIHLAEARARPAFLASVSKTFDLQKLLYPRIIPRSDFSSNLSSFNRMYPRPVPLSVSLLKDTAKPQQWMSAMVDSRALEILKMDSTPQSKARLLSASMPYAGGWLTTLPLSCLAHRIESRSFRMLVRYRLGIPLASGESNCPSCPNAVLDVFGIHAASCGGTMGRTMRHNRIRDELCAIARQAGESAQTETQYLIPTDAGLKPADVFIEAWNYNKPICLDVSVVNPLANSIVTNASITQGSAAKKGEEAKYVKYQKLCADVGLDFCPVVMETYGGFGDRALPILKKLGKKLADRSDLEEDVATNRVGNNLSFVCQKALSATFMRRYPTLLLE